MKRNDKPIKKVSLVNHNTTTEESAVRTIDYSKLPKHDKPHSQTDKKESEPPKKFDKTIVNHIPKPKEEDLGITGYVRKGEPVKGLSKTLITDFQVREVGLDGQIADMAPRKVEVPVVGVKTAFDVDGWISKLHGVIGDEADIVKTAVFEKKTDVYKIVTKLDKEKRTQFHMLVRELHGYDSRCDEGVLMLKKGNKKVRGVQIKGKTTKCVLRKSNIDTASAVSVLSRILKIGKNSIGYAGMKDKRGVTCQFVTFPSMKEDFIQSALRSNTCKSIALGKFETVEKALTLGDLTGNEFRVLIREVSNLEEVVKNCESMKTCGYINYYGLQRFGSNGTTHLIGLELMKGNYKKAVDYIMQEGNDTKDLFEAKQLYKAGEFRKAENVIPSLCIVEKGILNELKKYGEGTSEGKYKTSIDAGVMYKTKSLYLHAYQSYIWNTVVSKRVEKYGEKVISGDLVQRGKTIIVVQSGEEDKYDIREVVIPLVGRGVQYPENETKQWMEDLLKGDGLSFSTLPKSVFNVDICGDYRPFIVIPKNFKYETFVLKNALEEVMNEDGEIVRERVEPIKERDNNHIALWMEFTLEAAAYATMLFREILKMPGDLDNQIDTMKQLQKEIKETEEGKDEKKTETVKLEKMEEEQS
ncbi:tRNA pseudouridine synthase D, putative [Entamoeba invadens IP1]|uniref:tRNA pseudouridine synthase D, putative n=1 Tax=Entamoeba invadens IP1 TaxID=370355 RepID=A0A0A1UFE0_ENTIV|nr:tRNA pseudouridine synthase D, putative [Entamoeba invadens IP1]ELP92654.1 tRNA pseudouridine synthase D, putative [Entamoeba invadens IP1]|eukprot:XP_004259425.1 tRNA pseudouridine synthase D, putative [Entamoeba invadens IP1]